MKLLSQIKHHIPNNAELSQDNASYLILKCKNKQEIEDFRLQPMMCTMQHSYYNKATVNHIMAYFYLLRGNPYYITSLMNCTFMQQWLYN